MYSDSANTRGSLDGRSGLLSVSVDARLLRCCCGPSELVEAEPEVDGTDIAEPEVDRTDVAEPTTDGDGNRPFSLLPTDNWLSDADITGVTEYRGGTNLVIDDVTTEAAEDCEVVNLGLCGW